MKSLLRDFRFTSESDYSRALAALITPAYRFARFNKRVPLLWVEADDSQTGKEFFCECIVTLYRHTLSFSAKRNGGVGSLDEDISAKLIAGANMIVVDNIRGKLDSMFLESLLTADGKVAMRGAYTKNIEIDPSIVLFMATSNGAMLTRDQANRVYTIRLRKQPEGYVFRPLCRIPFEGFDPFHLDNVFRFLVVGIFEDAFAFEEIFGQAVFLYT